jgi:hypothetical protein
MLSPSHAVKVPEGTSAAANAAGIRTSQSSRRCWEVAEQQGQEFTDQTRLEIFKLAG